MPKLPRLKGKELIAVLKKTGFEVIRQKGSHCRLRNQQGLVTTVPLHVGETIGVGLLSKILKDCDLTLSELEDLLRN